MITLRRYWNTVQKDLGEHSKDCYSPDEFESWIYHYKYAKDFLALRTRCYDKLHSYPGSDEIAISYMDIGNCVGCAYPLTKLIIINPFHLLAFPEFVIKNIIPHEYIHVMLGPDHMSHDDIFFNTFEAVTGFKHPPRSSMMGREECKYSLEVKHGNLM